MKPAVILLVFSAGCATTNPVVLRINQAGSPLLVCDYPIKVRVASDVPECDLPTIRAAFEYWNQELGVKFFSRDIRVVPPIEVSEDADIDFVMVSAEDNPQAIKEKSTKPHQMARVVNVNDAKEGCARGAFIEYFPYVVNRNYNYVRFMMRHEIGHVLGLYHSERKGNLMYGSANFNVVAVPRVDRKWLKALKDLYSIEK